MSGRDNELQNCVDVAYCTIVFSPQTPTTSPALLRIGSLKGTTVWVGSLLCMMAGVYAHGLDTCVDVSNDWSLSVTLRPRLT